MSAEVDPGGVGADLAWRRASCAGNGSCIEVADLPDGGAAVRDGKLQQDSPILVFTSDEWRAFLAGVKDGEFD